MNDDLCSWYESESVTTWTSQDGHVYEIINMTTRHIQRCIAMIEREDKDGVFYDVYIAFKAELATRTDKTEEIY